MKATLALLLSLTLLACGGSSASVDDVLGPAPTAPSSPQQPDAQQKAAPSGPDASEPSSPADAGSDSSQLPDASPLADAGADAADSGVVEPPPPPPPPPPVAYSVSVSSGTQRVEAAYPPGLSGAVDATFEGWFNLRSYTPNGSFFSALGVGCSIAGDASYGANVGKVNCVARYNDALPQQQVFSLNALPLNSWHHVALVKVGAKHTLYLDGVKQGDATADFVGMPAPEVSSRVRFGGTGRADESLDGLVDEARLSLTADYLAPFAPPAHVAAGAALSLLLDEGAGTVVGGNTATLQGGCSWQQTAR